MSGQGMTACETEHELMAQKGRPAERKVSKIKMSAQIR